MLFGTAATLAAGGISERANAKTVCFNLDSDLPSTCSWDAAQVDNFQIFASSGRKQIDNALIAELKKILKIFPINPGFKFINDTSPNAFASQTTTVKDTSGTVFIGLNLINGEFSASDYGGVAVAGICAHECGHIYQFNTQWASKLSGPTAQRIELHADFLAGYYLGADASHSKDRTEAFAHSLFGKGDFNFNDRNHHGTPQQRVAAMRKGYETGQTRTSIDAAAQIGADFVGGL